MDTTISPRRSKGPCRWHKIANLLHDHPEGLERRALAAALNLHQDRLSVILHDYPDMFVRIRKNVWALRPQKEGSTT
jgi:hypothetical protein